MGQIKAAFGSGIVLCLGAGRANVYTGFMFAVLRRENVLRLFRRWQYPMRYGDDAEPLIPKGLTLLWVHAPLLSM